MLAVYVGNVLATPATPAPGFAGKTLATATFGAIDSHVQPTRPDWRETIKTKGSSDLYVQQNTWDPPSRAGARPAPAGTPIPAPAW